MAGNGTRHCIISVLIYAIYLSRPAETSVYVTTSGFEVQGSMKCHGQAVVTCSIKPYQNTMTWTIDGKRAAECTFTACQTLIADDTHYAFSFNTRNGTFNVTINPVTFADDGKTFKCDDGSKSDMLNTTVLVIPDTTHTTVAVSNRLQLTDIQATAGCVYPSSSIQFEWYIRKEGGEWELYNGSRPLQATNEYGCTSKPCGGKGVVKVTSTLTIHEDPGGETFYFRVSIKHPYTTDISIISDRSFKLKGGSYTSKGTTVSLNVATVTSYILVNIICKLL